MWCARSLEPQLSDNVIAPWEAAPLSSLGKLSLLPGDRKITVWDTILKILLVGIWTKLDLAQKRQPCTKWKLSCSCCSYQTQPSWEPQCHCTKAGLSVSLKVSKLQVDGHSPEYVQMHNCSCQRSLYIEWGGSQWAWAHPQQWITFAWISCSAHDFRCHHSPLLLAKQPGRQIVGIIRGVNMGALY